MRPIIKAEQISKQYRIGAREAGYSTVREALISAARAPLKLLRQNGHSRQQTIWALRDVSFEINPGEVVGIIGRNGAGKSTLLKILSRVTEPTTGRAELYGRVGSLLEVGTGFHPELTGRENIFLNGSILGMARKEIERKFDEIVAFAEIEKFLDTPVKRYSSGMYMRLAFSIAAHLEPEILLVDEVLAVGDVAFQKKCLGKMGAVSKEGRTVLFVSHNMAAIARICTRGILIRDGEIETDGLVDSVIRSYLDTYASHNGACIFPIGGPKAVQFTCARLLTKDGCPNSSFDVRYDITVEVEYIVRQPIPHGLLGIRVSTADGLPIFTTCHLDTVDIASPEATAMSPGHFKAGFTLPGNFLVPGSYLLSIGAVDAQMRPLDLHEDAMSFDISETGSTRSRRADTRTGVVNLNLSWDIKPITQSAVTGGDLS